MQVKIRPSHTQGSVRIPASKSMAHRALICAGFAKGKSRILNPGNSKDIQATLSCLESLGCRIEKKENEIVIEGIDPTKRSQPCTLNCNESGSTLRFFIPAAASCDVKASFTGQGRLLSRPMGIYADLFAAQNLLFEQSSQCIEVQGPLQPGLFEIPGDVSSQFISGLLFIAPLLKGNSEIAVLPPYESKSYVDLTLQMIRKFQAEIKQPTNEGYIIPGNQSYKPCTYSVEGDFSQMAFFGVLGALQNEIQCSNLDPESLQGDKIILEILKKAGANVDIQPSEIKVEHNELKAQIIDIADCPDLAPILCVLAAYTPGLTKLLHCRRLRFKESDRILAMETELKKWGVDISSDEDTITIQGKPSYFKDEVVTIDSHNDHRIVMAMTVFGLCAQSQSLIQDAQVIEKSYPDFFKDIEKVKGEIEIL